MEICQTRPSCITASSTHSLAEAPQWAWLHTRGTCDVHVTVVSFRENVFENVIFWIPLNQILVSDATKQMTRDGLV